MIKYFVVIGLSILLWACNGTPTSEGGYATLMSFDNAALPVAPPGETYKSSVFELNEKPARLVYEYQSDMPDIGGVFAVFVVPEGGSSAEGKGMPQIITSASQEKSTQPIEFTTPGRYFLEISAMGKWKITVEQEK